MNRTHTILLTAVVTSLFVLVIGASSHKAAPVGRYELVIGAVSLQSGVLEGCWRIDTVTGEVCLWQPTHGFVPESVRDKPLSPDELRQIVDK